MYRVRRLWLLLAIYLLGAFTYSISIELLLIIITPIILFVLMLWDEKSYQRTIKTKRGYKNGKIN
ncbi:hypothetical protein [Vagococcus luciliae]|uniref:Uncharacterized protein n=1 Tax=Vagococcus luciliae TaxID=2920380 RepID=A0ABY5P0X5_9ENTE|nr:hypothetical protein [Vagococcus luciliae]UUV99585.1 hypothetical protein G314FT_17460 [Vagococcus luciliae]